jgi:glycosyltransferase involved in cell wall biosynthesis
VSEALTIVHIVDPGLAGGMQSVVEGLAAGLERRGHNVHVIGSVQVDPATQPWLGAVRALGVTVHGVQVGARGYLRERRIVRDILRRVRPDVVHTHGPHSDLVTSGVARGLGIPVVTTLHGSSRLPGKSGLTEWLQFRWLVRFDAVIAVSRPLVDELATTTRVRKERVHWIPNAHVPTTTGLSRAAARAELGIPAHEVTIGWVARMIPVKACDNFVRAFAIAARGRRVRAAIVGDGPERPALETLAQELGVRDQMTFCGLREQAGRLFAAFDAFVLSSKSEGTPMTLLEAVAASVPVIATSVGGIPDVVRSTTHALLVPPNDSEALGEAIRTVLDDPAGAQARAVAARQHLDQELSAELWLKRHEALYSRLQRRGR